MEKAMKRFSKRDMKDNLLDVLELAVLVLGMLVVIRFVHAAFRDRQEKAASDRSYYRYMENSMQEYSLLHTSGNSYAAMVYSNSYKDYSSMEEAAVHWNEAPDTFEADQENTNAVAVSKGGDEELISLAESSVPQW